MYTESRTNKPTVVKNRDNMECDFQTCKIYQVTSTIEYIDHARNFLTPNVRPLYFSQFLYKNALNINYIIRTKGPLK